MREAFGFTILATGIAIPMTGIAIPRLWIVIPEPEFAIPRSGIVIPAAGIAALVIGAVCPELRTAETADGAFYEALGFVRESARKSGLHRTTAGTAAPAKARAPVLGDESLKRCSPPGQRSSHPAAKAVEPGLSAQRSARWCSQPLPWPDSSPR